MDIQFQFRNNKEGLFNAIERNQISEVRRLIEKGINVNSKDGDGWTPLMLAADNNNLQIAKLLVELGADLEQKNDDGETALMISSYNNSGYVGRYLISKGANPDVTDKFGRTAYEIAKENFKKGQFEYLLPNMKQVENQTVHKVENTDDIQQIKSTKQNSENQENEILPVKKQYVVSRNKSNFIQKKSIVLETKEVYCSYNDIYNYLETYFIKKDFNVFISKYEILRDFKEKFNYDLDYKDLYKFQCDFNIKNDDIEIIDCHNNTFITITYSIIEPIFKAFFENLKIGETVTLLQIKNFIKQKIIYNFDIEEYLDVFLKKNETIVRNIDINRIGKWQFIPRHDIDAQTSFTIIPSKSDIISYLENYINDLCKNENKIVYFSIEQIEKIFVSKFNVTSNKCKLDFNELLKKEFIDKPQNGYIIQKLCNQYIRIPTRNNTIYEKIYVTNPPYKILKKDLDRRIINSHSYANFLKARGFVLRETTYDSNVCIITYDEQTMIFNLAESLKRKFFLKNYNYSISVNEILQTYKEEFKKFDYCLNEEILDRAVRLANFRLENTCSNYIAFTRNGYLTPTSKNCHYIDIDIHDSEYNSTPKGYEDVGEHKMYTGSGILDEANLLERTGQQIREWDHFGSYSEEDDLGGGDE